MDNDRTALERAFELAGSGQVSTLAEIKKCLKREGYNLATITGSSLSKQIRELISKAKESENS